MIRAWLLTTIVLLIATVGWASDYDLKAVLDLAEKSNSDIRLAGADLKIASAEKLNAVSTALPQINISAGYNRNFKDNAFPFLNPATGRDTVFAFGFNNEYQVNAVLTQTLFSFKAGFAIQAARYLKNYTGQLYELTRQQVMRDVKTSFYQTLLLREVLRVAEESQESAKRNYDDIRFRFDNGIVSEFEMLQAEARYQASLPETSAARRDYLLAQNRLKNLIGLPPETELNPVGSLGDFPPLPENPQAEQVLERRADYNALIWEKKLRDKNVSAQRAEYLPTIEGSVRYSYSAFSDAFKLENGNDNVIVGLSLNFPLFSGGKTLSQIRGAGAEAEKVRIRMDQTRLSVRSEIDNLHLRMREAKERMQSTTQAVNTSRRAYEIAETRMANGLTTQLELKDSRLELDQAQVNYLGAVFDYLSAYFEWEVATGNSVFAGN